MKRFVKRAGFCSVKAETPFFLGRFRSSAGFGHSPKYYLPIIAVSHFAKVFSHQNFVSYGNIPHTIPIGSKPAYISSYIHKLLPSCASLSYEEQAGLINGKLLMLHSHTGEKLKLDQVRKILVLYIYSVASKCCTYVLTVRLV